MRVKKQLEIALTLDADNEKYRSTLEKLNRVINNENNSNNTSENTQQQDNRAGYARPDAERGPTVGDTCCPFCAGCMCADCCCSAMRGC